MNNLQIKPGATHYGPEGKYAPMWFRLADDGEWYAATVDNRWEKCEGIADDRRATLVPVAELWPHAGTPPVGTEVTIETNGLRIWEEAEQFIGPNVKVVSAFKLTNTEMIVVCLEEENACMVFRASMARPAKTEEQRAAEIREANAMALYLAVMDYPYNRSWGGLPQSRRDHFLALVDLGWQKVQP